MDNSLTLNHSFILEEKAFLRKKLNLNRLFFTGIFLMVVLSVFYIFQANNEISKKYLITQYESELSNLSKKNQDLTVNSIQINSLNGSAELLEQPNKENGLNFEKIDKIHYLKILDTRFVSR